MASWIWPSLSKTSPAARGLLRDAIEHVATGEAQVFVRVNALVSGLTMEDLEQVIQVGLAGVVLPKTESSEVAYASNVVEAFGAAEAKGLVRSRSMAE